MNSAENKFKYICFFCQCPTSMPATERVSDDLKEIVRSPSFCNIDECIDRNGAEDHRTSRPNLRLD